MTDESTGHTAQSGRVIEMTGGMQPLYFSAKVARNNAASVGWTDDRKEATVMTEEEAQQLFRGILTWSEPNCRVVEA